MWPVLLPRARAATAGSLSFQWKISDTAGGFANPGPRFGTAGLAVLLAYALTLATSLLPVPAEGCEAPSFGPATEFPVGNYPNSIAVADFNGDSRLDLAVANHTSHTVSILLGTGAGSFGAATDLPASNPNYVAVGDFNNDGKLDLAVTGYESDTVWILLGTGMGSFGAATGFPVASYPNSVAVGDFNSDGKLDLAVSHALTNSVSVLLGTGTGSFSVATYPVGGSGSLFVAVGDFNNDGNLDVATDNSPANTVSILLGTGAGTFGVPTDFPVGPSDFVAVADFNSDGNLDLAVGLYYTGVAILLGTGTGTFGAGTDFPAGSGVESIGVADFNGDGKLDLAVAAESTNTVNVILGTGTGSFGAATNVPAGTRPQKLAVGDFNSDGALDLAVPNYTPSNGKASILLNSCLPPSTCGNGSAEGGEQCDDGNTLDGDCCSSTCQFEPNGNPCDDGSVCTASDTCTNGVCLPGPLEMYWVEFAANRIQKANVDGTGVQPVVTSGVSSAHGLAVDVTARHLYWVNDGSDTISRSDLDGTNIQTLVTGLSNPTRIALDPQGVATGGVGMMYFADTVAQTISRARLDGSMVQVLVTGASRCAADIVLDLMHGHMYWTDCFPGSARIQRANLDGTNRIDVLVGLTGPAGLEIDVGAGLMYWTDLGISSSTGGIQRAYLDGSSLQTLVTGLNRPHGIALDLASGMMYWTNEGSGTIQRALLDGSGVQLLVSGLSQPEEIVLTAGSACACGNGSVEGGEECDDGDTANSDGCSATCTTEPGYSCTGEPSVCTLIPTATPTLPPTVTPTETPSVTSSATATLAATASPTVTPTPTAVCGDAVVEADEQCDDGNSTPGDGCDETCQRERASCCNNPNTTCNSDAACPAGDTCCLTHCDSGTNPPSCDGLGGFCATDTQCEPAGMCCGPVCGNGFPEPGEECDEGAENGTPGGICSIACKSTGLCTDNPPVACVTDADCTSGTCCGNGSVTPPEQCDDGNRVDDDACTNQCTTGAGVAACPGFRGADIVQATVKQTKFWNTDGDPGLERWRTKGSFILTVSQANRFDPERQSVQVRLAERDPGGSRIDLWPGSPVVNPGDCSPNLFCFPRRGLPTRFRWTKVTDRTEAFSPGLRKGRFKQRDNEFKFLFDGRTATIAAPGDALASDLFRVRQDVIVGGLCATVQLECQQNARRGTYRCEPTLLSP